jgi:hypothetical protein
METIQGEAIPIYLGSIDMTRPFYLCSGVTIEHLMLLSWGGEEADRYELDGDVLKREMKRTTNDVKRLGVDQGDLRSPNILWNGELGRVMLIDFEYGNLKEMSKTETEKRALIEKDGNIARKRVKVTKSYL